MNPTFHKHNAVYDMDNVSDLLTQSESNLHIFHKFWLSLIQKNWSESWDYSDHLVSGSKGTVFMGNTKSFPIIFTNK